MEAYQFPAALTVTLRNVGSSAVNLLNADFFINGVSETGTNGCTTAVTPGGSCVVSNISAPPSLIPGAAYPLKIVTPDDGVFSYSVIYGSNG